MCLSEVLLTGKDDFGQIVFEGYKLFRRYPNGDLKSWNNGKDTYKPGEWYEAEINPKRWVANTFLFGFHFFKTEEEAKKYLSGFSTKHDVYENVTLKVLLKEIVTIGYENSDNKDILCYCARHMMIPKSCLTMRNLKYGQKFCISGHSDTYTLLSVHSELKVCDKEGTAKYPYVYVGGDNNLFASYEDNLEVELVD